MFRTPFILPLLFPNLKWRVKSDENELFLTFDDGPVPGPTEFVLDTLKKYNAKATFFCIGDNIKKYPKIFNRIIEEGHAVGNHTFHHMRGWGTATEKYVNNVAMCDSEMASSGQSLTSNSKPLPKKLFRPPYGRIRGKQVDHLKDAYEIVMWDVLTTDYSQTLSPQKCLQGSIKATRPGSIIVFHDSLKAEKNMSYALPLYIEHFLNLGYSFKILNFE